MLHAQNNDTCITILTEPIKGKDAMLHGLPSLANTNWANEQQFPASAWTHSGVFGIIRSVIEFELVNIPLNAVLTSATLDLYAIDNTSGLGYHSSLSGPNNAWLERIIVPWDETTVTWNNQPATTILNRVEMPASTSASQNYTDIDVLNLVQDMLNNPTSSFGFMLKLQDENMYRLLNFCSSDHTNPALRPKLRICYTLSNNTPKIQHSNQNELYVYPNPANNIINIEFHRNEYSDSNLFSVINNLGENVFTAILDKPLTTINTSLMPSGMYFYTFSNDKELLKSGKIIIHSRD